MKHNDQDSTCRHCGVPIILWPPPHWMHDPGVDERTGQTHLYRYCRTTSAAPL